MDRFFYRLLRFNYTARQWLTRRFSRAGLGVLIGLIVCAIIGMDTNQSLSYQVYTLLMALLTVAIVATLFSRYRFSATRTLPRFGTIGTPLKYRLVLRNRTRKQQRGWKLLDSVADSFPSLKEYQRIAHRRVNWRVRRRQWLMLLTQRQQAIAAAVELPPLPANRDVEVMGEVMPLRRGLLRFKAVTVACPDPLGLFNACVTQALPQSVLILPKRYQLPTIQLPGARRYQSGGLALASSVGDSEEFRGLREYRPGDPPRKIHWKSWAKVDKPIVKEEQEEYFVRHALILDTFQSETYSELLEEGVAIASSLACEIQTQESLLDLMFVGLEAHRFTVGRGLGQTERMLELLASVVPCQDQPFESMMPAIQSRLALLSGCICILLAWDEARQALVEQLQRCGIPTLILVITDQQGLPNTPDLERFQNSQSSLHVLKLGQIQQGLGQL
ncbi:hypothetical protein C1752_01916 [Acaryochloris thomasi RCC1774]|uniref:DUF58 domain-containing protein n=1 Tax=Acaryochloris thomasi RCC1774 TaxID=1764569 RepID=A0A2W1JJ51_9CYAN|nr:DUF58 domain-containing protein [Acaryochloris thomasi]PZD73458.1 hypothetical protein C1752_01916 [Acaryochloris thomasi RCC1774]